MTMSESDTRAKLIDPALHQRGWTEDLIRREETAGQVVVYDGGPRRQGRGRVDYTLRVKVKPTSQPVAVALIEAKAAHLPPNHGLEQAKAYAACRRMNVPFVFASNGHQFVEFDRFTKLTSAPLPLADFPSPAELLARYQQGMNIDLSSPAAAPLLTRYHGGEGTRRYYQDAAIRAVLEKVAQGGNRVLLSLATGAGKTFIAVNLLKRIADAGQLRRALFVCDRDELRSQGLGALQNIFGADAAAVTGANPQKNARVLVATYQTLGVDADDADAAFLAANYPENYFSHIVIDECHRSAWGRWSQVLTRNPDAVQVGLTATPRQLVLSTQSKEAQADAAITADNLRYFGEPVYEYDMAQGIEDGYLAACEVRRRDIYLDRKPAAERETGVDREDLVGKVIKDATTGAVVDDAKLRDCYNASTFEDDIILPDRVQAMSADVFEQMLLTGGPEQKTIIFCARDRHADDVAAAMNNLYAAWCAKQGKKPVDDYAFKCTAAGDGKDSLPDLRGASRHHIVATTVDLLTTGVDVPCVRNIVFFKYVNSPIAFYQMVGRGTRIDAPTNKLMFRVYDYTDASRLFGKEFKTRPADPNPKPVPPPPPPPTPIQVEGFEVQVCDAGRCIVTEVDGKAALVTLDEYKTRLAKRLVEEAPDLNVFRAKWITPEERRDLLLHLPDAGRSAHLVRTLDGMTAYDLYDVLADLGYGMNPLTRELRAEAFGYKHKGWLSTLPADTAATVTALAGQFVAGGTEGLESPYVFDTPAVKKAGGINALKAAGDPSLVLRDTKGRIFAA